MKQNITAFLAGVALSTLISAAALAQSYPPPLVSSVGPNDLIQVVPNGNPAAGSYFAKGSVFFGSMSQIPLLSTYASTSATPGTVRAVTGKMSIGAGLTMTSGNLVGSRGEMNVPSGTTVSNSAAYLYGAQGKFIGGGTITGGNIAGLAAQIDASTGTYTAATLSGLWIDMGASASASAQSTSFGGDSHVLRLTNTTNAGAALTSDIIQAYANSNYFLNLGGPGGTINYFAAAGTGGSSCGVSTGAVAAKVLKVQVNGVDYWLPLCSSNS